MILHFGSYDLATFGRFSLYLSYRKSHENKSTISKETEGENWFGLFHLVSTLSEFGHTEVSGINLVLFDASVFQKM